MRCTMRLYRADLLQSRSFSAVGAAVNSAIVSGWRWKTEQSNVRKLGVSQLTPNLSGAHSSKNWTASRPATKEHRRSPFGSSFDFRECGKTFVCIYVSPVVYFKR